MKPALLSGAATAATLCLLPAAALALTPQEAWDRWKAQAEDAGMSVVAGGQSTSGDTLTVTDVAFSQEFEEATLNGTVAEIVLTDVGGDTVTVTMSDDIPMTMTGTNSDGDDFTAAMTFSAPDLVYTATDGPSGGTDATYEASTVTLVVDEITEDGEVMDFAVTAIGTGIAGAYTATGDDMPAIESTVTVAQASFDMSGNDPEEGTFSFDMTIDDISTATSSVGMAMFNMMDDPEALIDSGMSARSEGSAGAIAIDVSVAGAPETFDLQITMGGGEGSAGVDASRVEYGFSYNDLAFTASGSEIPFPQVTGALGQSQTNFSVPVGASDEAAPMSLLFALRDLTLGEEIWSMFDPAGALPRDPATFVLDIAGQARILQNLFSADLEESDEMPAEIEQVDINELRLSLVGAALTGEGSVALDYDSPGPFGPGSPAPDGTISLTLTGGQSLLDTLVSMGLIMEEQAMMARMMTGMLARPGDGPDTLVSEITLQPDGTILANGAPLPF